MKRLTLLMVAALAMASAGGCSRRDDSSVDRAIDSTKDALNIRDHEKLKDAAEDTRAAVKDAGQGIKDEVKAAADKSR